MYAVLDIETTGGKYNEEGITEIAIHKFDGQKVVDQFISLINPEKEIQPFVVKLTGITNQMLQSAPKFYEVAKRIVEITEDCTLVAHNAQFDYRILQTEFRRLGYDFQRKSICTVELSKELLPEQPSYSLGKLVRALGIPVSDRHRANGDALATVQLFKLLLSKDTSKKIVQNNVRQESVGQLNPRLIEIIEKLPSEVGVYYMYNSDGELIYLSKSNNIRKRVNKLFISSSPKYRKIQKEVKSVTYDLSGNTLIAELKEYGEVQKNKPKYNTKKKQRFTHGLYLKTNQNDYLNLRIDKFNSKNTSLISFVNYGQAIKVLRRITEEFKLCPALNGLDENLNLRNDACEAQEDPKLYNKRVRSAVHSYGIPSENTAIIDKGRVIDEHSVVLFVNGVYKGYGFYQLNHQVHTLKIIESIITPMENSPMARYLIQTYLRKKQNLKILTLDSLK